MSQEFENQAAYQYSSSPADESSTEPMSSATFGKTFDTHLWSSETQQGVWHAQSIE